MEKVGGLAEQACSQLGKVLVGQDELIQQLLVVVLCRGHALIEGVPGLAKTLAVKALAKVLQLDFQRVQCTPDLMPADVIGGNIFNSATGSFSLHRGPLFTDLLLVDEINRTPPRTQSALLESMEEAQVTIDGTRHQLSDFFTVFATQNPIEFEGTYPLPEAQLDRFLLKIRVGYPSGEEEIAILERYQAGFDAHQLERMELRAVGVEALREARAAVSSVQVEPGIFRYVSELVRRSRDWPSLSLGASPRAGLSLLLAAKAIAAMDGRDYLVPDDVKQIAPAVLRHRVVLKPEADLEGVSAEQVVRDLLAAVEVPK
ncbi:MAG TPA: MoxR family ATPase [Terriglobales bacterium]|jgi:MoxR-like ATPase|nr:MoxR family ATPase [Terriglobales bacterium]